MFKKSESELNQIILENLKPILSEYSDKNSISIVLQKKNVIMGKNELI